MDYTSDDNYYHLYTNIGQKDEAEIREVTKEGTAANHLEER